MFRKRWKATKVGNVTATFKGVLESALPTLIRGFRLPLAGRGSIESSRAIGLHVYELARFWRVAEWIRPCRDHPRGTIWQ